jgi:hypothetical protein
MQLPEKLPEPVWHTYRPAHGDEPEVRVLFAPITPAAVRSARRAVATALAIDPDDVETAGDELSRELLQRGIIAWEGVGGHDDKPVTPVRDRVVKDDAGKVVDVIPGTISLFLSDTDRFEWADRVYVLPWAMRDQEKNASSASPSGTGKAGTRESNTATSPAKPRRARAAKPAPTRKTSRKATKGRQSGR